MLRFATRLVLALQLVTFSASAAGEPAQGAQIVVRYRDGKLWLRTAHAQAADVLRAVSRKTRVRFAAASEVEAAPLTLDIRGTPLETAMRMIVSSIPKVAGHTMVYARAADGRERLVRVNLFVAGRPPSAIAPEVVYGSSDPTPGAEAAGPAPPPIDYDAEVDRLVAAGVDRVQATKVMELTREVRRLRELPSSGPSRVEELSPKSVALLQGLLDQGIPPERAVQMLLVRDRYESALPGATPGTVLPTPVPSR